MAVFLLLAGSQITLVINDFNNSQRFVCPVAFAAWFMSSSFIFVSTRVALPHPHPQRRRHRLATRSSLSSAEGVINHNVLA